MVLVVFIFYLVVSLDSTVWSIARKDAIRG